MAIFYNLGSSRASTPTNSECSLGGRKALSAAIVCAKNSCLSSFSVSIFAKNIYKYMFICYNILSINLFSNLFS